MITEPAKRPWYAEPFVWLVIAFPLTAVVAGMITIWIAVKSDDGLVIDDYYKEGLGINRKLERDKLASDYSIKPVLQINREDNKLLLTLTGNEEFNAPEQVSIQLLHSTRSGFDSQFILDKGKLNSYQGPLPELIKGKWYVLIEADNWRVLEILTIR